MGKQAEGIRRLLRSARRRWFWHTVFRSSLRAAVSLALVAVTAWLAWRFVAFRSADSKAALGAIAAIGLAVVLVWALWPLRRRPSDAQVARFIEERCPQLEDRLVTAVDGLSGRPTSQPALAALLYDDAARSAAAVDLDRTISRQTLLRTGALALVSAVALGIVAILVWPMVRDVSLSVTTSAFPAARVHARKRQPGPATPRAPRVARIDVQYEYPPSLGLTNKTEEDGGDIYGPFGTLAELRIQTDRPADQGELVLDNGTRVRLSAAGDRALRGRLTVRADGSYRVALTGNGATSRGDTEYFIRVLADSPPDVRIVQPGSDRQVTPLEEVPITAHAEDDRGVKGFDLVYAVRGGPETAVPFRTEGTRQAMDGRTVLYLEDLRVQPGDFVTYYARARDAAPGSAANEARSDIYFLQVTPFDEEFVPPQSQAAGSGAGMGARSNSLDDLIRAQKQIVVATWKLDRRARKTRAAGSEDDVRTVARAQGDLKNRAAEMAGPAFAAPRKATSGETGQPDSSEPMASALEAMGQAEQALQAVDTRRALPHETRALNELMKAQASQRRKQMMRASGSGAGNDAGNTSQDLTSLFDRELQRQQQTNYELPRGAEQGGQDEQRTKQSDALDQVRRLAERQGELGQQQQDLARDRKQMSAEEFKRQLERLTREQSDLRQQAEELAQQMKDSRASNGQARSQGGGGDNQLRDASDAMRRATARLREGNASGARAESAQALEKLQSAEQQVRRPGGAAGAPALGDLQMEARQAADAQRQMAREAEQAGSGKDAADAKRRLAGEKERLADRLERLQQGLKRAAASAAIEGRQRQAIDGVTRDFERLDLPKQMRDGAAAMRSPEKGDVNRPESAAKEQDLARTLDRLADRIGAAAGADRSGQAGERLAQTRDIQERLAQLERRIGELQKQRATDSQARTGKPSDARAADGRAVGTSGNGGQPGELERLREQYVRELQRAAEHLDRLGREGGAAGLTPEGQERIMSAPGFHQDFSKWEQLAHDIDDGLERAGTTLSKQMREQQAREHLPPQAVERAPEAYRRLIEQYYESLAKKGGR